MKNKADSHMGEPRKRSRMGTAVMVATGVSIGMALSFFFVVSKGVKNCLKTIDGLKDSGNEE